MQIRSKLTLQFLLIGGMIMIIASVIIYLSSARFYRNDFYDLLRTRARNITQLVLDSYEFNVNHGIRAGTDHPARLQDEKILILNSRNDTLYISDRSWNLKTLNTIAGQTSIEGEVFTRQDEYEVLGTLYSTGEFGFVVIAAAIDYEGPFRMMKLRTLLIIVCLIGLIMFSVAGWFYSGKALKPISNVVKKVEEITITSLNLRVPEGNGTDEIGRLAKTFNRMLERLENSFAVQKDFIANASHELRTPLTSINGQIEVLMMKDRSTNEYKSALESVLEDIRSLIDLSNRLLLIARTSAENPAPGEKKIRVDEVLWQARDEIRKFNKDFHINILLDNSLTDSEQMAITGDEYLIRVAVSNIIDNACKYSPDHSVRISLEHSENCIDIIFEDKGIGISETDMSKIFEPFYRGSNTLPVQGTGIGLSLVKRIVENHNGTINITSKAGHGTTVRIRFRTGS